MSEFGSLIDLHTLGRPKTVSRPPSRPDVPKQKADIPSESPTSGGSGGRYSTLMMSLRTPQTPASSCAPPQREPLYLAKRRDRQVRAFWRSLHERTLEAVLGRGSPASLRDELVRLEAEVRAGAVTHGDATDTALESVLRAAGTSGIAETRRIISTL